VIPKNITDQGVDTTTEMILKLIRRREYVITKAGHLERINPINKMSGHQKRKTCEVK
jgi:hypothetical protein